MSNVLGDLSQLPMNVAFGAAPDTTQNPLPTGPTPVPMFANTGPQASTSTDPSSTFYPQSQHQSLPPVDTTQPQYITDFTRMFNVLADNQVAFQQGVMQILGQPPAAPKLGSSVKVRNPRMFTGKHEEVVPFLSEVNRIIQFNSVSFPTDNHKVLFLALYLNDGIPVEWFNHLEKIASPLLHTWDRFLDEFKKKFSDPRLIQTAEYKLDRLVQTGSAHSYLTRFIEISSHLDMTEQTKISRFMKGLKPAIKDNLVSIINRPQTLHGWENIVIQVDANIHQRDIEKREESGKKPVKPSTDSSSTTDISTPVNSDVVPMEIDAIQTSSAPRGKLTQAERDHRIKNNLCLYCGKAGHTVKDHPRKTKPSDAPQQGKVQPEEK
jgi:hypothetical protein